MKRLVVGIMSIGIAFGIILLAGLLSAKTSKAIPESTPTTQVISSPTLTQTTPASIEDAAVFKKISFARAGSIWTFSGKITSNKTGTGLSGVSVEIICDDAKTGNIITDNNGEFQIQVNWDNCDSGSVSYVQATYTNKTYESERFTMPNRMFGHSSSSSISNKASAPVEFARQQAAANPVPEFSAIAYGGAILLSLLGILYIRKQ